MTHCTTFLRTVSLTSLSFLLFYNFTYYIWFEIHVYKVFPLSIIEEEEFTFHRTSSPLVSDPFYRRNRPFDFVFTVRPRIRLFSISRRHYRSRSIALISETFESYHITSPNFITFYISPHILLQKKGLPALHYFSIIVGFIPTIVYQRCDGEGGR